MANQLIISNITILTIAAFFLGLDKGGFRNLSVICMYLMLNIIPSKQVIGILAPIYLLGDIIPIYIYRNQINYKAVFNFVPLAIIGIIITSFFASFIDDRLFTIFISFFLLLMVIMITIGEITKIKDKSGRIEDKINKPLNKPFTLFLSLLSGITTVSNAAGAITCIYFFRQTKEKKEFVGSTALFFFSLNITKVIIFIFFWKNITFETLKITLAMLPGLFLGILASIYLIKIIPQKIYNFVVILSVYYIAIMLFVNNII
ncbi:MAG: sulfite exporter TauE/SafE family protein [Pleomorphochaeta sp.]